MEGKLPAGTFYREMVMGFDVHATALAAAGFGVPPSGGQDTEPAKAGTPSLDGDNPLPFLTGENKGRPHDQLFWRSGEQHATRVGDWKLIYKRTAPLMANFRERKIPCQNLSVGARTLLSASASGGDAALADKNVRTPPAEVWVLQDTRRSGNSSPLPSWRTGDSQGR